MNSSTKALLLIVAGILVFVAFAYDVSVYVKQGGVLPGENPALEYGLTALKLAGAISFFVSAINAYRQKK